MRHDCHRAAELKKPSQVPGNPQSQLLWTGEEVQKLLDQRRIFTPDRVQNYGESYSCLRLCQAIPRSQYGKTGSFFVLLPPDLGPISARNRTFSQFACIEPNAQADKPSTAVCRLRLTCPSAPPFAAATFPPVSKRTSSMRNKLTLTALTIAVTMALAAPAQAIIRWERDIESAKQLAKQTRRLVLLHFWSDDCPPCRQLEKNVFPRSEVQRSIAAGYVAVKIHGKQSRHLTEQFDVRGWPTDIIMTPDGREIYRTTSSQDPNKYIRLLDTVVAHARVNKPAQHTAAATAQTPRAATAPNQPPSRFSSSGQGPVSQRRTVNPQATSRYGQPPQRPATNAAPQFATRPAPPQPTMRINPYIARNPSPAPPSGAGAPSRYSGPQAHATRPAGQTPAAQTPVAQNRAERNNHHQTAPVPTDPSSRYGRRSPAQQFAARQQANNPPAAPSAAPSVAQAPSSRQPTIDAPPSARVAYTTGASRYGAPAAGASRSGAPDAAANRYGSPAAPPRQADSRQAASNQTRRPGTSSPVGQNQYVAENRSSYSPPYAEQSRSQTRQSYGKSGNSRLESHTTTASAATGRHHSSTLRVTSRRHATKPQRAADINRAACHHCSASSSRPKHRDGWLLSRHLARAPCVAKRRSAIRCRSSRSRIPLRRTGRVGQVQTEARFLLPAAFGARSRPPASNERVGRRTPRIRHLA